MKPHILVRIGQITGIQSLIDKVRFRQDMGPLIKKRLALGESDGEKAEEDRRKDFFYYLLNAKDPETGHKFNPMDLGRRGGIASRCRLRHIQYGYVSSILLLPA